MLMQMVTSSKAEAVSGVEWMEAGYGLTVGPNWKTAVGDHSSIAQQKQRRVVRMLKAYLFNNVLVFKCSWPPQGWASNMHLVCLRGLHMPNSSFVSAFRTETLVFEHTDDISRNIFLIPLKLTRSIGFWDLVEE